MNNLELIRTVARHLGPLLHRVVFLGGATVGILLTDPAASLPRPTNDVDLVLPSMTRPEYLTTFQEQLLALGFTVDTDEDAPMCRWTIEGVKVDLMPPDEDILGFSNQWYPLTLQTATTYKLEEGLVIKLVTAPLFLATKIEAFHGRGRGDFQGSHDFEDIITVIDGRKSIVDEIEKTNPDVRNYLASQINGFINNSRCVDNISQHLGYDEASKRRYPAVMNRLKLIANLK